VVNEHVGQFIDWHLKLWGEAIDADKATMLPMPNADDDADHDAMITATVTGPAATSSVGPNPDQGHDHVMTNPTDHPVRPTKPAAEGPKPTETGTGTEEEETTGTEAPQETTSSSWVNKLPSFGASKKATLWIYGALGLIVLFCIGLGVYLWVVRRRRLRNNPRNNYDFELLDDEELDALNGEKGIGGRRSRRTRGGELYDAFAGGSDEEDEEFDDDDDDDDGNEAQEHGITLGHGGGVAAREYQGYSDRSRERLPDDDAEQYVIGEESDEEENEPLHGK
jgi:kexin